MSNEVVYQIIKWNEEIHTRLYEYLDEISPYGTRTAFTTNVPLNDQELNSVLPYGLLKLLHTTYSNSNREFKMFRLNASSFEDDEHFKLYSFNDPISKTVIWTQLELSDELFAVNFMLHIPSELRQYMLKRHG